MKLQDPNDWGLTAIEYAHREKLKLRERAKKRLQRARIKIVAPPIVCEFPVQKYASFRLKAQDIQELGIVAIANKRTNVSLPFVSILHGARQGSVR